MHRREPPWPETAAGADNAIRKVGGDELCRNMHLARFAGTKPNIFLINGSQVGVVRVAEISITTVRGIEEIKLARRNCTVIGLGARAECGGDCTRAHNARHLAAYPKCGCQDRVSVQIVH